MSEKKRSVVLAMLATSVFLGTLGSCARCGNAVDEQMIRHAMSDPDIALRKQKEIVAVGEPAIPLILAEMRAHPDAERLYIGSSLITEMAWRGTADPSAPHIRRALDDSREDENVRCVAAGLLRWYWGSPKVLDTLAMHARRDVSEKVRTECILSLAGVVVGRACRGSGWTISPDVRQLFVDMLNDPSAAIRKASCKAVETIMVGTLLEGKADIGWGQRMLAKARGDKEYGVRKCAVDALAHVEQERRKAACR